MLIFTLVVGNPFTLKILQMLTRKVLYSEKRMLLCVDISRLQVILTSFNC